jgi:hypothetical protein
MKFQQDSPCEVARTPAMRDCAYNFFRNKERPKLFCAVPEDHPVPSFVVGDKWSFEHRLGRSDAPPPGFKNRAASVGVRFNGFHLFHFTARDESIDQCIFR